MKLTKLVFSFLVVAAFLASCAPAPVQEAPVVEAGPTQTPVVVEVERVITATPAELDKSGGTFVWGVGGEMPGFNPILNNGGDEIRVYQMTSEPLTWGGENFPSEQRPILAESWERSEDGLTWTIHLRQGVKWSDGEDFTADDVLFWAQALEDPNTTGAEGFGGRFYVNDTPYAFTKVDDYTVTITTAAPVPTLLSDIGVPIIPEHYFTANGITNADMIRSEFNTALNIGTGPFKMVEYRPGEAVILARNEYYWRGTPYLENFIFRLMPDIQSRITALQTGEVDFARIYPNFVPELVNNPNIQIVTKTVDMQYHLRLNVSKPYLADKRTRQALYYALDRDAILQSVNLGYGQIADSPFNPVVTAYVSNPIYNYDPEKAKALLAEVGWVPGSDGYLVAENVAGVEPGTKFSLVLDVMSADEQKTMVMTQAYWQAIGIDATIRQIDYNVWNDENTNKVDKPYDVIWSGIGFIGDNGTNYQWLMASSAAESDMSYENQQVIDIFTQARSMEDIAARDELLKQAAAIIWDDLPYLPLYYDQRVWAINRRVHYDEADWQVTMVGSWGRPDLLWVDK